MTITTTIKIPFFLIIGVLFIVFLPIKIWTKGELSYFISPWLSLFVRFLEGNLYRFYPVIRWSVCHLHFIPFHLIYFHFKSLILTDKNLDIMREEKGVVDLINAMESHETDSSVMDFTCSALWGLSLEGTFFTLIVKLATIKYDLISAIESL